jgi:UDP-GlcNAc:undecaprenyl-phosphate GlcNAc-1-phosphate transferase
MKFDLFANKFLFELGLEIFISFFLVVVTAPVGIAIAEKLGLIDVPGTSAHKKHAHPTPLAGGLILSLTLPISFGIFILWRYPHFWRVLLGATVIFIFGLADDKYGLSATQKFSGQILATIIAISSGISVRILESFPIPLEMWMVVILDRTVTLFWIVGITNAFNLIDSMDGLAAGLAVISTGFFSVITIASGQTELTRVTSILLGAFIGLYFYNKIPARLFLGDSGSQVIGFFLAAISILYNPPDLPQGSTWFVPILLLGIPIFDTSLVIVSRLRRRKPIFHADLSHTYHRMLRMGLSPARAVLLIHLASLLLSIIAYTIMSLPQQSATIIFLGIMAIGISILGALELWVKP